MSSILQRPELAESMANQLLNPGVLDEGLRSGLFLSGLRRTGKTTFLRNDLIPALEAAGALVIYVDLWSDTLANPATLVHNAILKTLQELQTPVSPTKARFNQRGKSMDVSTLDNANLREKLGQIYENEHPLWAPLFLIFNASGLGIVDRYLSKKAMDFELRQIRLLIAELEKYSLGTTPSDSPDLIPALRISLNAINESRSEEKVRVFASILANLWHQKTSNWDATSQTLRLVRDLEDVHFLVLSEANKLHIEQPGKGMFSVGRKLSLATSAIEDLLPSHLDPMLIASCVSDLISKGLLNDSFISNNALEVDVEFSATNAPVTYSISDLGVWLIEQITPAPAASAI